MSNLIKMVQGKERNTLGLLTRPDGSQTKDIKETLEHLFETHFPESTPLDFTRAQHQARLRKDPDCHRHQEISAEIQEVVTPTLVIKALHMFGNNKAAGVDKLKPIVFKNLNMALLVTNQRKQRLSQQQI